ncbi:MAG: UbiA family prenyltransferase [Phycisphaerae bacterium]|nr:UbiA family prenyltransferase [Phycisphaerae bacterium]
MIIALIRLMRLYYTVPIAAGLPVIIAYVTAGNIRPIGADVLLASFSLGCVIAATYVLNDVCDVTADRINRPRHVLVGACVLRRTAASCSICLFAVGMIFAAACNRHFFLVMAAVCMLAVFYDLFSKRIGLFKVILVALLMTSLYPLALALAAPADSPRLNALYIFPLWLFLSALGYEMLKDIRDADGDAAVSPRSIARHSRKPGFLAAARVIALFAGALSTLPALLGCCGGIYLGTSLVAVGLMIASTFSPPARAIPLIYVQVFLVTVGSLVDLLVLTP